MTSGYPQQEGCIYLKVRNTPPSVSYYDTGYQAGLADAQAGRTYDPVAGSHNLPANASREHTRGYAAGYDAGRP